MRYGQRAQDVNGLMELFSRTREEGFGPEVKRRIILGTYVLSSGYYDAYYSRAQKVRSLVARDFAEAFKKADIIVGPPLRPPLPKSGTPHWTTSRPTWRTSTPSQPTWQGCPLSPSLAVP